MYLWELYPSRKEYFLTVITPLLLSRSKCKTKAKAIEMKVSKQLIILVSSDGISKKYVYLIKKKTMG